MLILPVMVQIESSMAHAGLREYKGNSDAALDPARLDYNARYTPGFDTVIRFKRGINRLKMALKEYVLSPYQTPNLFCGSFGGPVI